MILPVLILSRYSRKGASSRLRTMQYRPYLEAEGLSPTYNSLFNDDYLARVYDGRPTFPNVVRAMLGRVRQLRDPGDARLHWVEKETLPWMPWAAERLFHRPGLPIVVDYDDAIFHRYDLHRSAFVRRALGRKIDKVMATSDLVTAGNAYLAERARIAGARRVEIVPTVVDLDAYTPRSEFAAPEKTRIGWIGTPGTWQAYVAPMQPLLISTAANSGAKITAVGAGDSASQHPSLDVVPWSESTEVARIQEMDIGLMPLDNSPWAQGKCGYKLIQYMACAVPVVASPVGVNRDIVEHGVNGFLASTDKEWQTALTSLLDDPDLRRRMGANGRRKVETQYSLQVWGPRVASMLKEVAAGSDR